MFDTHDSEEAVLGFYNDMLYAAGWKQRSAGEGPAGFDCEYAPADELTVYSNGNQPHDWIEVSTAFIPRKGEYTLGTPLAGFRGKGVPFAPVAPGVTRYWLMTPDY